MKDLLSELQLLLNKANLDYKNRVWLRHDIYGSKFNKLLEAASNYFKEINTAPIEIISSDSIYAKPKEHEAYSVLAERIKLKEVIDKITSLLEELSSYSSSVQVQPSVPINNIELVCNNFCSVVRELRRPTDHANVLEIDNEGDVLYLFKALLRLYFDSIFQDTWHDTSSEPKNILLIPEEKTALMIKRTHRTITDKEISSDFLEAINYYHESQKYHTLLYFIYDPELRISQPKHLENQLLLLNKTNLNIKVFIRPLN